MHQKLLQKNIKKIIATVFLIMSSTAFAAEYKVPSTNQSLIGDIHYSKTDADEKTALLAKRYDVGYNALENANPHLNLSKSLPSGLSIKIPNQHLLPNQERKGIIINLAEMRMYYFPKGSHQVLTYPIGIGKIGKTIPITNTSITKKTINPTWTPPEDIREFNLQQGIILPKKMPPGPDNPLGPYAIYMRLPTYLIHSTIFPESVGKRASFGCIRMYESDIQTFFPIVTKGIPVAIINSPVKVAWQDQDLYLETHRPLEEHSTEYEATMPGLIHQLTSASKDQTVLIDWQVVSYLNKTRDGVPHAVGVKLTSRF
jgi:L,D-transpeptidase ErfK/SrfK